MTTLQRDDTLYISREEFKASLEMSGTSYADSDIEMACRAASRAIDQATGRIFYPDLDSVRYYTGGFYDDRLEIDYLTSLTSLEVDLANNGTFGTTWAEGQDFELAPFNAPSLGYPYERILLRPLMRRRFPPYSIRNVKITGDFGWAAPPEGVKQYAKILASKLVKRSRETPYGIITMSDFGAVARIAKNDPDFLTLLGDFIRARSFA